MGGVILAHDEFLHLAREVAMHHHERWDGGGYPDAKPSREFHLATRIVSVVDVFDALVSPRPYKKPWLADEAAAEIERGAGTQFDPTVVAAFLKLYRSGEFADTIASAQTVPA
jgi:putative two-component system response regulator